jgi:acyl-CoA synthetase (AMP-forming)/AMP-acid ligase II
MLLGDTLVRTTKWYPDKTAAVSENTRLTYADFNRRTNAIANALIGFGIKPQDHVAIICQNSNQYMEVVYASAKIGAVATCLNWRLSAQELAALLNHSDSKVVFYSKKYEHLFAAIRKELIADLRFVAIGGSIEGAVDYEKLVETHGTEEPRISGNIDENDTVIMMYTSGTTGKPKGVMITHKNIISNAINTIIEFQAGRDLVYLNILPLFHVAIFLPINCVMVGGTNIFLPEFNPGVALALIEQEKVTFTGCAPAIVRFLVEYPEFSKYDLSSLRLVLYAAAPMPVPVITKAIHDLKCDFVQVFGMTETSPVTHILIPEEHVLEGPEHKVRRLSSVGRPIINVRSKIVDEHGKECPIGVVGEIVDQGDTIMKGYYKMPEATAETIKDGWLYTGDMGYADEYGYVYLADRKKDMIISGAENIYPAEVEMCILKMSGIADAAVIGVPDEKWGETVKAIVVRKPGANVTAEDVIEHCKANIASFKKPQTVDFVDALPRNVMGKIQKNILREPYWAGRARKI